MTQPSGRPAFGALPSVDRVLRSGLLVPLLAEYGHPSVTTLVRRVIAHYRDEIARGSAVPTESTIVSAVVERAREEWSEPFPVPVLNATGVILHTNLGRAPLSDAAREAIALAAGYSALEMDLQSGERASRQSTVADRLRTVTGAPDAYVAVNNAAAITLALAALARGKEVVVSRGELVEIGGGFRVPSILRQSGARLVEVGTTNRTRLEDYEEAITPRTAAILRVHTSNFKVVGFAERVETGALAGLARSTGAVLLDDNGSGALLDTTRYGLAHEPTPMESLRAGTHLVAFSGDKLLGGPQCGILVGESDSIRAIARHPLARALRPDKLSLAALSATLLAYLRGQPETLPVWRMIALTADDLARRAEAWRLRARQCDIEVELVSGESTVGGGSLPGETLPTTLLRLPREITAEELRMSHPRVVARTQRGRLLLDLRTIHPDEDEALLDAVCAAARPSYSEA